MFFVLIGSLYHSFLFSISLFLFCAIQYLFHNSLCFSCPLFVVLQKPRLLCMSYKGAFSLPALTDLYTSCCCHSFFWFLLETWCYEFTSLGATQFSCVRLKLGNRNNVFCGSLPFVQIVLGYKRRRRWCVIWWGDQNSVKWNIFLFCSSMVWSWSAH